MHPSPTIDYERPALTAEVQAADPLHADPVIATVPALNNKGDVAGLIAAMRAIAPMAGTVAGWGPVECLAAMRDLGLIIGSVKRHGPEPLNLAPELVPVLQLLGERTDMVPRDTILHYTVWNPAGPRQRMYTDDQQEGHLQESVRIVFPDLQKALGRLEGLSDLAPADALFAVHLGEVAELLQPTVESMALVSRHVTPAFFAHGLRPYLEAARIDGVDYFGPAAAQLPMWLVDKALWANDHNDTEYEEFLLNLVPYSLPRWRRMHANLAGGPSLAGRVVAAFGPDPERAPIAVRNSAAALVRALRVVVMFRGRHLGIARQVYELDDTYTEGSGGGSVDLLRQILNLTKENARLSGRPTEPGSATRPPAQRSAGQG
ncbi:monodechloroaminopyrrolnitrin synthase PrnB family protein [Actinoplanes sp. NPDC023801]|uniref:monodechloroaminopyrrolnitrin synthase PrnB family protein n=1 Tax=Actinoplanes sp. NPDC023801 TaxID=3154595 RepID=UPI003404966A